MMKKVLINEYSYGSLRIPNKKYSGKIPGILFLHGFGTNKDEVGNTFLIDAQKICEQGIASLCIDFSGFGESKGITSHTTIDQLICDAVHALDFLINHINRIGLCGFSLGAGISILIANWYPINSMALLSPAGNLSEDFNSYFGLRELTRLERSEAEIEMDLGWRKIKLKNTFIQRLKRYHLMDSVTSFKGSFFVISGTNDFSYKHAKEYMDIHSIAGADHIFNAFDEEKSSINEVTDAVTNWFSKTL